MVLKTNYKLFRNQFCSLYSSEQFHNNDQFYIGPVYLTTEYILIVILK